MRAAKKIQYVRTTTGAKLVHVRHSAASNEITLCRRATKFEYCDKDAARMCKDCKKISDALMEAGYLYE